MKLLTCLAFALATVNALEEGTKEVIALRHELLKPQGSIEAEEPLKVRSGGLRRVLSIFSASEDKESLSSDDEDCCKCLCDASSSGSCDEDCKR